METNLEQYIAAHTSAEDSLLQQLFRETHLKTVYPRMASGHVQGKLLELISKIKQPKYILEIGTFTGYSAICLARGLGKNGILHTIEKNDELRSFIEHYIEQSGLSKNIELHIGNAFDILPEMDISFDLAFLDAEKIEYPGLYELIVPKLGKGGILLADNVLWGGKVYAKQNKTDKETVALKTFNTTVQNDPRVENTILPVRDGLSLIRRI